MEVYGEGSALLFLLEPLGRGCGRISRKGWDNFFSFTRFDVENGTKISFWHDQWCGEVALKVAFPVLFGFNCTEGAFIMANLKFMGGSNQWNVSFTKAVQDWEMEVFTSIY